MRLGLFAILLSAVLLIGSAAGCAQSQWRAACAHDMHLATVPPPADSRLLFDPGADYPRADNLAYHSDWPSTPAVVQGLERIAYRESIYDIQGIRGSGRDLTFRRFRMERVGGAQR